MTMREYERAASVMSQWLRDHGMTAAELSRQTGIDAGILRSILKGKRKSISTRNVFLLARHFGLSMQQFIDSIS